MNYYFLTFEHHMHTKTFRNQSVISAKCFGDAFLSLQECYENPHILFCKNITAEEYNKIHDWMVNNT